MRILNRFKLSRAQLVSGALILSAAMLAYAVPNVFTAGTPISAAQMNANFVALERGYAYVVCNAGGCTIIPGSWEYNPTGQEYNPTGQLTTVTRSSAGNYQVTFTGMTSATGGHVQVTAYGSAPVFCQTSFFIVPSAGVRCFSSAGVAIDATFNILMIP